MAAVPFGRGNNNNSNNNCIRFYYRRRIRNSNQKKRFQYQKLEHQKHNNKVLSLDPHRKNQYHHFHNQNVEEQEQEEEEEEKDHYQEQVFHANHHLHSHFQQPHEVFSLHNNHFLYQNLDTTQQLQQPQQTQNPKQPKKRSYISSSSSSQKKNLEHAKPGEKMGTSSRFGLRNSGGEIVEVQGGHIIRSIGRKDRHSKVCTAKGPRDRRVRLSAHTAIQFYDVQDRLGYDRPSKAVDWLIKKAQAAIDELEELPPWKPTTGPIANSTNFDQEKEQKENFDTQQNDVNVSIGGSSSKRAMIMLGNESEATVLNQTNSGNSSGDNANASFLPQSLDSDTIADTIKSFFPVGGSNESSSSSAMQFQSFQEHNLLSRTSSQSQDLRLSLQSFQDPILLHHQNQHAHHTEQEQTHFQASNLFNRSTQLGFDASGWSLSEHQQQQPVELGRVQRLAAARAGGDFTGITLYGEAVAGTAGGYLFNSPPAPPLLQQLFGQNQFFSQRGPLQSSYSPPIRAWIDPSAIAIATADPIHHHQAVLPMYSTSISGIGFASELGGFSGFRIPARIQGEIEEHDGISDKPSSASSDSRH